MKIVKKLLLRIKKAKVRPIESFLMFAAFWWASCLLLPVVVSPFGEMKYLGNGWFWALFAFAVGILHFLGMYLNCKEIKKIGLMFATGLWFFVSTTLFINVVITNILTTGVGIYFLIGCLSAWLFVRVGVQIEPE